MPANSYPLNMAQIKADLFMAESAIEEAKNRTPKEAKYIKGQAGYHLQQAAEKMIKIQLYYSGANLDLHKMYKHPIGDLIAYARSINVSLIVPPYVNKNRMVISSWEAEGRYDVHIVVKINRLESCFNELTEWYNQLQQQGFK